MSKKEEPADEDEVDYDTILSKQEKHKRYLQNELDIRELEQKVQALDKSSESSEGDEPSS